MTFLWNAVHFATTILNDCLEIEQLHVSILHSTARLLSMQYTPVIFEFRHFSANILQLFV